MLPVVYYCDHHEIPLPKGHKFPMRKYALLRQRLQQSGLFDLQPAPLASSEQIELAHDADYVRSFLDGTLPPAMVRRIGFPWSPQLVARTLASVGSTMAASVNALRFGWSGGLAGGTHHAFRAEGSGYCIFNDVAVAIASLRASGQIRRAAVVDLDVHQGDGTAAMFEHDDDVLTISLHGRNNFPFRKQTSKIDVEFENEAADETYLGVLEWLIPRVKEFDPDIVYFQAGVDALRSDTLGRLSLTHEGLLRRDRIVTALPFPLVVTLGGGYANPIEDTVEAHASTFLTAATRPSA